MNEVVWESLYMYSNYVQIGYGQLETVMLLPIEYFCILFLWTSLSVLKYKSHISGLQQYINKIKTSVSSEITLIAQQSRHLHLHRFEQHWFLSLPLIRKSINWTLMAIICKNSSVSVVTCTISWIDTLADRTMARLGFS